ncbi:MAG: archaellum operon transcriptional activator EarA family protein [Candidatus Bathyarchaeia archaeon]|jgi:predicted transcriptional regulator with HTH domain
MSDNSEVIRQTILRQLSYDSCCRIHIHRECCVALGLSVEPLCNEKNQRIRICKDLTDNQFNKEFDKLINEGFVQKLTEAKGYAFYSLTEDGKKLVEDSS